MDYRQPSDAYHIHDRHSTLIADTGYRGMLIMGAGAQLLSHLKSCKLAKITMAASGIATGQRLMSALTNDRKTKNERNPSRRNDRLKP